MKTLEHHGIIDHIFDMPSFMQDHGHGPSILLESADSDGTFGRWSLYGTHPVTRVTGYADHVVVQDKRGTETVGMGIGAYLEQAFPISNQQSSAPFAAEVPYVGGLMGQFSYNYIRQLERLPGQADGEVLAELIEPGILIAVDHEEGRTHLLRHPDLADHTLKQVKDALANQSKTTPDTYSTQSPGKVDQKHLDKGRPWTSSLSKEAYTAAVRMAKLHIRRGDIFQVVLSRRLERETTAHPLEVYKRLRALNPSPYMFYSTLSSSTLAGASPEMLVQVTGEQVRSFPIAGTRKRGQTAAADRALELELIHDPKEAAEHLMLVDLSRNDVGRVSDWGSVQVPSFRTIHRFSHVMHLVSEVRGTMRRGKGPVQALNVCFPAGTVSGAPKVRAMELIQELESGGRGYYAGAVGWIGLNGQMDTCITIRTLEFTNGRVAIQAGAGIVQDSDPLKEYEETARKAMALQGAVEEVEANDCITG